ncbi:MAG: zinc ribbon domain-containing protein [Anaerolineales bacterium]|nr:zinc ribbon domain-containing protein [Anaerolineales bacterium]
MPIYTYRCESCGIQFDQQQSFNDDPLTVCPECEEKSLHKVYRPVGIVFKGSGFYSTDNRSPSGQKSRPHKDETNGNSGASKETASQKSGESTRKETKSKKKT